MSALTDSPAYAEESDVQAAMQEVDAAFDDYPLGTTNVEAAVISASRWFRRRAQAHFYDSGAQASDLISTTAATATNIQMDIPSSPHPQPGQLMRAGEGADRQPAYPVTRRGRYARASESGGGPGLPYRYVESIDRLSVRDLGGDRTDWVAASDKTEGEGEDYYLTVDGGDAFGDSYLWLDAGSLGGRYDYSGVLEVDVSYGVDWQDTPWADVRRGIAHVAAAELSTDDDVLTSLPENAMIANVETQADLHLKAAMDRYLGGYLKRGVA
jgi:hypothetical protein